MSSGLLYASASGRAENDRKLNDKFAVRRHRTLLLECDHLHSRVASRDLPTPLFGMHFLEIVGSQFHASARLAISPMGSSMVESLAIVAMAIAGRMQGSCA